VTAPEKGRHVLVVDDDQDFCESMKTLLEKEGYEVTSASDGLKALEILRWGLRPNVILLDMSMTVMNGREFQHELKLDPRYAATPVIVVTGTQMNPSEVAGWADWISKPIKRLELLEKIERCSTQS
jgi:CheY-like chemotaxis protein